MRLPIPSASAAPLVKSHQASEGVGTAYALRGMAWTFSALAV